MSCPARVDRQPDEAFISNVAHAALIIPAHFGRDMARGANSPVQMLVGCLGRQYGKADFRVRGQITRAYDRSARRFCSRLNRSRPRYGCGTTPDDRRRSFRAGHFRTWLVHVSPMLASLAMAKEGEQKTILQVYVSSISAHEFLLGKILAFMAVALAECLLMLVCCLLISD